jgi:hypothetical protein
VKTRILAMVDTNDYPKVDLLIMGIGLDNVSIDAKTTNAMTYTSQLAFGEAD